MDNKRLKACQTIYGGHSINYYIGAIDAALEEADALAAALRVDRTALHGRLEQMAALVMDCKQRSKQEQDDE